MVGVIAAVIFSVAIPVVIMAMLEPSLDKTAPKAGNFRGVMVYNGLGVVWFVWVVSFWIADLVLMILGFGKPAWVSYIEPLFPVLAVTCAFGLFDDWAGCNKIKGFSGHLKALAKGQLTTGGLKFLGIGCLSLLLAIQLYYDGLDTIPRVLLVTCVIALNANLMNLFDLRPGRAQKIYLLILALAIATTMALAAMPFVIFSMPGWDIVALALAGIGPVLAVWRFDLGEKGMIGDAGANAMGVLLGYIFATVLPIWPLFLLAVGLAAVNILSERISFTKIIAGNRFLSRLDELGRRRDTVSDVDGLQPTSGTDDSNGNDKVHFQKPNH